MIIDTHVYCLPPELRKPNLKLPTDERIIAASIYQHAEGPYALELASPGVILESMHESDIDRSILVPFPWSTSALCEQNNRYVYQLSSVNSEFFWVFSLQPLDKNWRELAEANLKKGALGVKVNPAWQGFELDGPEMCKLAEWVINKKIFIMVHVDHPFKKSSASPAHLYNFAKRNPKLKILACHMGGLLGLYTLHQPVAKAMINVWFDTAISSSLQMVQWHLDAGLENKIVFGSDFPFNHCHSQSQVINGIRKLKLNIRDEEAIFETNFYKLSGVNGLKRKYMGY